jgi:hypothetical protein
MDDESARVQQLELQLQMLNEKFEQEMRVRGFDPDQAENVALPAPLARLYIERQALLEQLDEIRREGNQ